MQVLCTANDPTSLIIALRRFLAEVDEDWTPDEVPTLEEVAEVMNRAQAVVMPTGRFIGWNEAGQYVIMDSLL
jgi:hypothetical protein